MKALSCQNRYGTRSRDGGEEIGVSLLTGASTDRGSFVAGFEHDSRDAIFDADRAFTAARKEDKNGDGVIQGYQETVGISIYGYTLLNPAYDSSSGLRRKQYRQLAVSPRCKLLYHRRLPR